MTDDDFDPVLLADLDVLHRALNGPPQSTYDPHAAFGRDDSVHPPDGFYGRLVAAMAESAR